MPLLYKHGYTACAAKVRNWDRELEMTKECSNAICSIYIYNTDISKIKIKDRLRSRLSVD